MNSSIIYQDATKLAELIRTRQLSPVEVMQAHIDRIEAVNPAMNAIVTIAGNALEAAKAAESVVMSGKDLGPLHGVPFTVKDSIDTAGLPTQRGSPIFKGRIPAADATTVARMKSAGGIVMAKTNLPEFSYWIETDNLLTGRTNNPWNLDRTPGGSSGGESAAIAAGMSPIGLGSDVAISLRGPAAHTGIIALKATHGRIPMSGLWPRAPRRFWHVGPMARSVRDIGMAYSLLAGPDGLDGYATMPLKIDAGIGVAPERPLRIGWLVEPGFGPVDTDVAATVKAAADALESLGVAVEPVSIPVLEQIDAIDVFWKLQQMESKPAFLKATAGHEYQIFKYVKAVYDTPDTSIGDFVAAEQQVEKMRDGYAAYFDRFDALLCPVTPVPAPVHGAEQLIINGQSVSSLAIMQATSPFNLTGLPALSMRFGTSREGLPIAIQVVAPWLAESTILHVASLLESVSPVRDLHPTLPHEG
jgi:aspartyl-tRNA(Asn)/glutamyl-tRNA(Gln) amidotransferase subunit A